MKKVSVDGVDHVAHPAEINAVRKPVSDALGTTDFAVTYHELEPGDALSGGLHTHHDQEEVFYVVEGTATFDVGRERDRVEVTAGEAVRFAPGEFQHGYNDTDGRVVALAIGAPGAEHDWADNEVIAECRECDEETVHGVEPLGSASWQAERLHLRIACGECGASFTTAQIVGE